MSYKCQTTRVSFAVVRVHLWKPVHFALGSDTNRDLSGALLSMEITHFTSLGPVIQHLAFPHNAGTMWGGSKLHSQKEYHQAP